MKGAGTDALFSTRYPASFVGVRFCNSTESVLLAPLCSFSLAALRRDALRQGKRVKNVLHGDDQVLPAVKLVGHGGGDQVTAHIEVPESLARRGIQSKQIAGIVRGEKQVPGGGQDPGNAFAIADLMVPNHTSVAVVHGTHSRIGPQNAVAACPAFGLPGGSEVINAEAPAGVHIKQTGLGIETRRHPIAATVRSGFHERSVRSRSSFRLSDGAAARIHA